MALKESYDGANPNDAALGRYDFLRTGLYQGQDGGTPRPVAFIRSHYMDNEGNVQDQIVPADEKFLRRLEKESINELSDKNNPNPNSAANLNMVYNALPILAHAQRNPTSLGAVVTDQNIENVTRIDNILNGIKPDAPKLTVDPLALKF